MRFILVFMKNSYSAHIHGRNHDYNYGFQKALSLALAGKGPLTWTKLFFFTKDDLTKNLRP